MSKPKQRDWYWLCQNVSPVCPYCADKLDLEYGYSDGEGSETECPNCGKTFHFTAVVSISYDTHGDCKKNNQMPHRLYQAGGEHSPFTCQNCYREFFHWQFPDGKHPKLKEGEFIVLTRDQLDKELA